MSDGTKWWERLHDLNWDVRDYSAAARAYLGVTNHNLDPVVNQGTFAFGDPGTELGHTLDTAATDRTVAGDGGGNYPFFLRIELVQTLTNNDQNQARTYKLQYQRNGTGGFSDVTGASTHVQAVADGNITDGAATTNRISGSANTFLAGSYDEADGVTSQITWSGGTEHTEMLWSLQVIDSAMSATDFLDFRVIESGGTTLNNTGSEDQPRLTWNAGAQTITLDANTPGAVTASGTAAAFSVSESVDAGAVSVSGTAATLRIPIITMAADAGTVTRADPSDPYLTRPVAGTAGSVTITNPSETTLTKIGPTIFNADPGAVATVTGTDAALNRVIILNAEGLQAVQVTGTDAGLNVAQVIAADAGAVSVTGTAAALERALVSAADAGSVTVTGTAATLNRVTILAANAGAAQVLAPEEAVLSTTGSIVFPADPGAVAVAGTAAPLSRTLVMAADAGSVTVVGQAITRDHVLWADLGLTVNVTSNPAFPWFYISRVSEPGAVSILAPAEATLTVNAGSTTTLDANTPGAVAITGTDATLHKPLWTLVADAGAVAVTDPSDAYLTLPVPGTAGTVTVSAPEEANIFIDNNAIPADAGAVALAGTSFDSTLSKLANDLVVVVTGTDVGLFFVPDAITALPGGVLVGVDPENPDDEISLKLARKVVADAGAVSVTGTDATITHTVTIAADPGAVTITNPSETTLTLNQGNTTTLVADAGAVSVVGQEITRNIRFWVDSRPIAVAFEVGPPVGYYIYRTMVADAGAVTLSGTDAALTVQQGIAADSGSVTISGTDASLLVLAPISADAGTVTVTGVDANLRVLAPVSADAGAVALVGADAGLSYVNQWEPTDSYDASWTNVSDPGASTWSSTDSDDTLWENLYGS